MLRSARVLIAEDQELIAWDLAASVKEAEGEVVGPVATVGEALAILEREDVHAAILDVQLADGEVTPLARALLERGTVVLFHTATGIPSAIAARYGDLPVCPKPMPPEHVVFKLASLIKPTT